MKTWKQSTRISGHVRVRSLASPRVRWRYCRFGLRRDPDGEVLGRPLELLRWWPMADTYPSRLTEVVFPEWPDHGWVLLEIGPERSARDSPAERPPAVDDVRMQA